MLKVEPRDTPVTFEDRVIAECFLRDGLRIALVDQTISPRELRWLNCVAEANNISQDWLDAELGRATSEHIPDDIPDSLA